MCAHACRASREAHSLARVLTARGLEYERNLDVRAAVQCFEVGCSGLLVPCSGCVLLWEASWVLG